VIKDCPVRHVNELKQEAINQILQESLESQWDSSAGEDPIPRSIEVPAGGTDLDNPWLPGEDDEEDPDFPLDSTQ
jgi:hypothetical protein